MEFIISHYIQLSIALFAGAALFLAAYSAPPRIIVTILILMAPFPLIGSRYGTLNMFVVYLAGAAFLVRGRIRSLPLLWAVAFIFFAYLLSTTQALKATYIEHLIYIVSTGSNFVLFYIVYNHFLEDRDIQFGFNLLIWVAVLVSLYCGFSLAIGFDRIAFMGIDELAFGGNLEEKKRLVGPFGAPGSNSEFLATQILLLGYIMLMFETSKLKKAVIFILVLATFGFLVATGSRGGIIALPIGAVIFLWSFRKSISVKQFMGLGLTLTGFAVVAVAVIKLTEFNVMFERLEGTKFEGVVPDSRVGGWEPVIDRFQEKPALGYGPGDAPRILILHPGLRHNKDYRPLGYYPHNLYLFLAHTVGAVGFVAYILFFGWLSLRWWNARSLECEDTRLRGIPALALVLIIMFLVSQYRIEFLRFTLNNYQHYMFALWAMLLAFTDVLRYSAQAKGQHDAMNEESFDDDDRNRSLGFQNENILRRKRKLS